MQPSGKHSEIERAPTAELKHFLSEYDALLDWAQAPARHVRILRVMLPTAPDRQGRKLTRRKEDDARPLSTLRPRCAASGYYAGEGEGESETHKRLCVAEGNDGNVRKFGEREGVRKAAQVRRIVCAYAEKGTGAASTMDRGSCGTGDGDKWIRNGRRGDRDGHLLKDVGEKDAKDGYFENEDVCVEVVEV
ncbi:hypothetical protein EI94DRAFT_1785651, partial [Lactarius quietus]